MLFRWASGSTLPPTDLEISGAVHGALATSNCLLCFNRPCRRIASTSSCRTTGGRAQGH